MTVDLEAVKKLPLSSETRLSIDAGASTLRLIECDLDGNRLNHDKYVRPWELFSSMDEGIAQFLLKLGRRPVVAVVGAAGIIEQGRRVQLTNMHEWPVFDVDTSGKELGIEFHLFNDLVVAAASLQALQPQDLDMIRPGDAELDGPKLVVTLSTGLNDALALPGRFGPMRFVAGESGHTPMAPRDETELAMLKWEWQRGKSYVSFEDAISGKHGFLLAYEYATQAMGIESSQSIVNAIKDDPLSAGPLISKGALQQNDPACRKAMEILGGVIGTYLAARATSTTATGGLYLVGSISANENEMNFFLENSAFLERFKESGPMTDMVQRIPIYRVLHPEFGILGASEIARHLPSPS